MIRESAARRVFQVLNYVILTGAGLLCLLPVIHVLAVSFSSSYAAGGGWVGLWPVAFTVASYRYAFGRPQLLQSIFVSIQRILLGGFVNMLLTMLTAYPLSKDSRSFRMRTAYSWFFVLTMLIHGGLIPTYMAVRTASLLDSIWALVLPGALPVFNMVVLINFFRQLPQELEEAALMDGASHWMVLFRIFVPLSLPALATLTLFSIVGHWNAWFDGLLYMNHPVNYPLSSYLQTVIINRDPSMTALSSFRDMALISDRTFKAAQIFVGMTPILVFYPFLQRYFIKGLTLGSVKG